MYIKSIIEISIKVYEMLLRRSNGKVLRYILSSTLFTISAETHFPLIFSVLTTNDYFVENHSCITLT